MRRGMLHLRPMRGINKKRANKLTLRERQAWRYLSKLRVVPDETGNGIMWSELLIGFENMMGVAWEPDIPGDAYSRFRNPRKQYKHIVQSFKNTVRWIVKTSGD